MKWSHTRWSMFPVAVGLMIVVALIGIVVPAGNARAQDAAAVSIHDFTFDPGTITVAAGTTVTWTNNDTATHTVTADDGSFDSGNLPTGQSFSMTFDTPGTYTYHCAIHPNMTATVVVTDASTTSDNGATTATNDQSQTGTGPSTDTTDTDMANMSLPNTGAGNAAADRSSVSMTLAFLIGALAAAGLATAGVGSRRRRTG